MGLQELQMKGLMKGQNLQFNTQAGFDNPAQNSLISQFKAFYRCC